jgi:hypothetical protein
MITGSPTDITDVTAFSCPYDPGGAGDRIDRGFYVTNYPARRQGGPAQHRHTRAE